MFVERDLKWRSEPDNSEFLNVDRETKTLVFQLAWLKMEGDRDVETDTCRVLRRFYFVLLL